MIETAGAGDRSLTLRGCVVWGHPGRDTVILRRGRIYAIGRSEELDAGAEETIDAGGGTVIAGFVDAHVHLMHTGLVESGWRVDLSGRSRDETLAVVRDAARARGPAEWVVAAGWDESRWQEAQALTRLELDAVAPRNPVVAVRVDGHVLAANSLALSSTEATAVAVRPGDVDRDSGRVREEAAAALISAVRPDRAALGEALRAAASLCHRMGITGVHTMCDDVDPDVLWAMASGLRLRAVIVAPIEVLEPLVAAGRKTGDGDEWVRWGGLKLFADGSIGARNAAVEERFRDGGHGALFWDDASIAERLRAADRAGWQTLVHAIGGRAIEQVVRAHETVGTSRALRHRIEHFELPADGHIERARRAGLCVCMQPNFVGNWSGAGGLYDRALGPTADGRSNPFRQIADAGLPLGFGSDGMPVSPLYGLACAVRPPHDGQRLSLAEALSAYTAGGAYLAHEEADAGGIDVGKRADLVVLDSTAAGRDADVGRWVIDRTFVGGECVYDRTVP
ncbi:MAG: amidohydrolase [Candidatus Bipolaricaulia bacterium]